jgi:hypothetical protein
MDTYRYFQEINETPYVVFSPNSLFNIRYLTNVNDKNIYQIDMGDCLRHISFENYTVYIGIIYNDTFYIFNLIEDGIFTDDFKNLFKNIDKTKIQILSGKLRTTEYNLRQISQFFKSIHNFSYIKKKPCKKLINFDVAKAIINDLNVELNKTCPNFRINIDYIFNLEDHSFVTIFPSLTLHDRYTYPYILLLCLFNGNNCVSSITINFDLMDSRKIDIDSRTDIRYEGRKFNKLLRCVLIIIAKALDERKQFISSEATNLISALLMIKSLNAVSKNDSGEIILDKSSSFEDIKSAMEEDPDESIISVVELNDENIQNAKTVFYRTIQEINCTNNRSGKKKRKNKTNKQNKTNKIKQTK